MKLSYILLLSLICSCASTSRTKYEPHGHAGGYSNGNMPNNYKVSRFTGNAYTVSGEAKNYSIFRAIESCLEEGFEIAKILDIHDLTTEQVIQRTSHYSYQAPSFINGQSNTRGTLSNNGFGGLNYKSNTGTTATIYGGSTQGSSQTWSEKLTFPSFDTTYFCTQKSFSFRLETEDLKADQTKEFMKDFFGGVLVKSVPESSPNNGILKNGDLIIKVNGQRVETYNHLIQVVHLKKFEKNLILSIYRDGLIVTVKAKTLDVTDETITMNKKMINDLCRIPEISSRPICNYPSRGLASIKK